MWKLVIAILLCIGLYYNVRGLYAWFRSTGKSTDRKPVYMIAVGAIIATSVYLECCVMMSVSFTVCLMIFTVVLGISLLSIIVIAMTLAQWMEQKLPYKAFAIFNIVGFITALEAPQLLMRIH